MAMEPVLLVCEGCGARLRTAHPGRARGRACPRCASALGPVVDRALGVEAPSVAPAPDRRRTTAALAILVTLGSLASLAVRGASTRLDDSSPTTSRPSPLATLRPSAVASSTASTGPDPAAGEPEDLGPEAIPHLSEPPPPAPRNLAILDNSRREPSPMTVPVPIPIAIPAQAEKVPPSPAPEEGRRFLVRDGQGRAIVAREYGSLKGQLAAILPDGQIGWPESLVVTKEPFAPLSMDEMKRELLGEPAYATFRVLQTEHYLVVYRCGEPFARASGELLEKLLDGLTGTLRRNGLPIGPVEFPLVAVIFGTEDDFRANRKVARDVQAYYEILSNRIYFYETSSRDQDAPEVSALRKPQTVAHEGTHQILQNVGVQPRLSDWPIWLVEGLAEYCSATRFGKKGVDWSGLGQVNPIHLATIRDLDDPMPNQFGGGHREAVVAREKGTPLVEYLATRKELTPTDYASAWALTHYLATQRLGDFVDYLKQMSRLRPFEAQTPADQLAAFRQAFGNDLAQMDAKVGKYLKKFKPTDALPHYAVIFEQPVGPIVTRRHYMVSQSPSVIRQWIESVTAPEGGEPRWRIVPHPTQKKALEAAEQWMGSGSR